MVSARADYFERVHVVQQPDAVLAHADRRGGYLVRRLALQRERREVGGGYLIRRLALQRERRKVGRHLHAARLPVHYLVHDLARFVECEVFFF